MKDRIEELRLPMDWDEAQLLRETFLQRLSDPALREALRDSGVALASTLIERSQLLGPPVGSYFQTYLKGVAADLRHLAGHLRAIRLEVSSDGCPPEEIPTVQLALEVLPELEAIALRIEASLGEGSSAIGEMDRPQPSPADAAVV